MPTEPLRLLIDTDPGTDDAVALVMALRHPAATVEALTVVAGNVDVDQCVRNARYVLEVCGRSVPVYRGAAQPLSRPARTASEVHGGDGLGDLGLRPKPGQIEARAAAEAIVALIRANPSEITLVTLAPLTNIALALDLAPEIAGLLRRVVVMGGAANTLGNVTPAAEFNIWCDPEAARIVFASGMPLTMIGVELCRGEYAHDAADQEALRALGTPLGDFVASMAHAAASRTSRRITPASAGLPDAVAMAVALDPSILIQSKHCFVDVETKGDLTSGETVVDRNGVLGRAENVEVGERIDTARYKAMVLDACRS